MKQVYLVGGAVRDALLGLPGADRDYVVVGATVDDMLAQGFQPVGHDFPVFLHPKTHAEYALARTERKTAPGYRGFVFCSDPAVTLEEDLARRDLTINAIAQAEDGRLIDPYGGEQDLRSGILRHVSPAFAEDPVRILRLARFAARFTAFTVAPETLALMRAMVEFGEVDALVPERIWQELSRGLMTAKPSRMFRVLRECGALERILPELNALWGIPQPEKWHPEIDTGEHVMQVVDYAAAQGNSLPVRFAAMMHDLGKADSPREYWPRNHDHEARGVPRLEAICARLKVPNDCRDLAKLVVREHDLIGRALELRPATVVALFERSDAFRKPERFLDCIAAEQADFYGRHGASGNFDDQPFIPATYLPVLLAVARAVPMGEIARHFTDQPQKIRAAIHTARVAAAEMAAQGFRPAGKQG